MTEPSFVVLLIDLLLFPLCLRIVAVSGDCVAEVKETNALTSFFLSRVTTEFINR